MADSGVPFSLGAANVPLVEDLSDIPVGQDVQVDVLVTGFEADDDPQSATLAIKVSATASDVATTTILKTITQSPTADGVITATADPKVWRVTFALTRQEGTQISRLTTYVYSVVVVAERDSVEYTRMVQRGAIRTTLYPIDDDAPLADGAWTAGGALTANGFDP